MKPATPAVPGEIEDRGERTALMGPLLVAEGSRHRAELTDLVVELAARSAGFRRSLPDGVRSGLATPTGTSRPAGLPEGIEPRGYSP